MNKNLSFYLVNFFFIILCGSIMLLFVIIPQVNLGEFVQSTITSKFLFFAYSCFIILGVFIIYFLSTKLSLISISKLDLVLLLWLGFILLNRYVIQLEWGFSLRFFELLGLIFLYIVLRNIPVKYSVFFFASIVISGIIQAVYGNLQLLDYYPSNHSGFKLTGSFFNPGPYAGFLTSVWLVALGMYLFKEKIIQQVQSCFTKNTKIINKTIAYVIEYIPLLGIVSILFVMPATHSRGAWLAIVFFSLVLVEFRYRFIKNSFNKITKLKKWLVIIVAFGVFTVGLLGVYHFKKGSADGRLFIWKVTTEIIKDFPLTGVGFDRFKAHYMNYQANYFAKHGETAEALVADNTYYAFNEWLQLITENGVIGFGLFVLILIVLMKTKVAQGNLYLSQIIRTGTLAIGVFAFFSYPMQILPIKLILICLLAFMSNLDKKKYSLFKKSKPALFIYKTSVCLIGILLATNSINYLQTLKEGFIDWEEILQLYKVGVYDGIGEDFNKIYPVFNSNGDFLMNYGKALTNNGEYYKGIEIFEQAKCFLNTTIIETSLGDCYKATKQFDKAELAYQHAANMIPIRFYPHYLLARLYDETEQKEKSIAKAKELLVKEVKIKSTAIKEMQVKMQELIEKHNSDDTSSDPDNYQDKEFLSNNTLLR